VARGDELPTESSAELLYDASPLVLPLVDSDTLVIPGPDDDPGETLPPHAARTRAARTGARITRGA